MSLPAPSTKNAEAYYYEGLAPLMEFETLQANPDPALLRVAASHLHQSLKLDPNHVQPYVCLAYIALILEDKETALEYLNMAEDVDASFPPLLALKNQLKKA